MVWLHLLVLLSVFSLNTLAAQVLHIKAWPFSAKPIDFSTITYHESTSAAVLDAYTPLTAQPDSAIPLMRLGYFTSTPETEATWSGIAVPIADFAADKNKTLRLLTATRGGAIQHLSFTGTDPVITKSKDGKKKSAANKGKGKQTAEMHDALLLEVVHPVAGKVPAYNKPVVLNKDGQLDDKPPEKSFLQKYWWAIGLFLLVQVVIGGGGGEEGKK